MKKFSRLGIFITLLSLIWFYSQRSRFTTLQTEKTLVTLAEAEIKSFDPAHEEGVYTAIEVTKVYEGLYEYAYLKDPFELTPNLAAAMPTVSDDRRVYKIKLKEGVKFQDDPCFENAEGRELTAEDFVYSIKRIADPHVQSGYFGMFANKIEGLDDWRERQKEQKDVDYSEKIAGLQALDKYTLQITVTKPWTQLIYLLAMTPTYAVAKEAVDYYGKEFLNHPVGTGPFVLKSFNPQLNKLVYQRNPTFREKLFPDDISEQYEHMRPAAGKKLPLVDKIVTHILPEEQPRWLKFKLKKADLIDIAKTNIALDVIKDNHIVPSLASKKVQLFQGTTQAINYFVFNTEHKVFKNNPKLRKALTLAFDRDGYNQLFYNGTAVPAQSIVPLGLAGYLEDYVNPNNYNIAKAKQLLAEAGYPAGKGLPPITLDVRAATLNRQKGEFFQKCMAKIGVRIKIASNIFPELVKKVHRKQTMMHAIGWSADYPDADNFLQLLYKDAQRVGGIGANFDDAEYNKLYEEAAAMQKSPARTAIYEQLNKLAAEKLIAIYTVHEKHPVLYHHWVKNYRWSNCHYGNEQYIDIDLEAKKASKGKL